MLFRSGLVAGMQSHQVLDGGDDVLAAQAAIVVITLKAQLAVDLVAADARQIVTLGVEVERIQQVLAGLGGRGVRRTNLAVQVNEGPPPQPKKITIEMIQKIVASHYGVEITDLLSKKRNKQIVIPRQVAMYLCRKLTDASYPQIGDQFGGKDHTTVIHAHDKMENVLKDDQELASIIEVLSQKINPNYTV